MSTSHPNVDAPESPSRDWETLPKLEELIYHHTPGYEYAHVLAQNVSKYHSAGWRQVKNCAPYNIAGLPCFLFRKLEGDLEGPIWGGNHKESVPRVEPDHDLAVALGLREPPPPDPLEHVGVDPGPPPTNGVAKALAPDKPKPTLRMPAPAQPSQVEPDASTNTTPPQE